MYTDISDIRAAWDNREYYDDTQIPKKVPDNHVFDENMTIRENREKIIEWNENVNKKKKEKELNQSALYRKLTDDIIGYLMYTYNFTKEQASKVESFVYTEKHSFMADYFGYIDEVADMVYEILNLK